MLDTLDNAFSEACTGLTSYSVDNVPSDMSPESLALYFSIMFGEEFSPDNMKIVSNENTTQCAYSVDFIFSNTDTDIRVAANDPQTLSYVALLGAGAREVFNSLFKTMKNDGDLEYSGDVEKTIRAPTPSQRTILSDKLRGLISGAGAEGQGEEIAMRKGNFTPIRPS